MALFNIRRRIAMANLARTKKLETARLAKMRKQAKEELELEKINAEVRKFQQVSRMKLTPAEKRVLMDKKKRAMARKARIAAGVKKGSRVLNSILKDIEGFSGTKPKKRPKSPRKR